MVPKRGRQGLKDYAPDGTAEQKAKLQATREEFELLHQCERILSTSVHTIGCGGAHLFAGETSAQHNGTKTLSLQKYFSLV